MSTHPLTRLRTRVVTTPAGTASSAPQQIIWQIGRGVLGKLDVVIPAGHAGLTGIAIVWGGRQIVPYEGGEWIVGNDDEITIELELYVDSSVVVTTYNTDVWDHSHYLRAYMHDLELAPELVGTLPVLELPGTLPPAGLPPEITPVEDVWGGAEVTAEEFLSQLQDILSTFLDQLTGALGTAAPPPPAGGGGGTYGEALQVPVPSVVGLQAPAAEQALTAAGFGWYETDVPSAQNPGTVIAQAPAAGTLADPTVVTVQLQVAVAPPPTTPQTVAVPNVVGKLQGEAQDIIRHAGLRVAVETVVDKRKPKFTVVRQRPAAGTQVQLGSTVTITTTRQQ